MIEFLEREIGSNAPIPEDQSSAVLLESYAQETGFPMHSLKFARAWDKELDILYVLHCRALEEIVASPALAAKGSPPHNALVKHYHAYRRMVSTRFKTVELENILPHPSWLILYDPDFVFSQAKWSEFTANPDLLAQCASLLERYHSWWLKGEGQNKNDLHQRMNKTGVLDPIEDITREEWELFYSLFPAIHFALIYLSRYGEDLSPVENIALTDVNGVPDFPGFDLWLQRKGLARAVQARGACFLLGNLELELRPLLMFYAFLRFDCVRKEREQIIQGMRSLMKKRYSYGEFEEEANKYIHKMHY
ncbi:MAG: hypothetical protein V5B78_02030 [Desulfohalobiaceae bacterium]